MSKVRADQFPNYQTVPPSTSRPDSRKTPSGSQHKCAYNLQNEMSAPLSISKNIENPSNSSTESPS